MTSTRRSLQPRPVAAPAPDRPVEIALLDRSGVIAAVNRAWETFALRNGGDPDRCGVGASYLAACDAADGDPWAAEVGTAVRAALRGELPIALTVEIPCHGPGKWRWFDVLISSRFDDVGACIGATVTLSRTEGPALPTLGTEPGPGQDLLDLVPDAVVAVDPRTLAIAYANPAATELLDYTCEELVGMPVLAVSPDVGDIERRARQASLNRDANGHRTVQEVLLRARGGQRIPCEVHVHAGTDVDGQPWVINVLRDLRERQAHRKEAQDTAAAFYAAFDRAPVGMSLTSVDSQGHRVIRRANRALAELTGMPLDKVIGRDVSEVIREEDSSEIAAARDFAVGARGTYSRLVRYRRLDGVQGWVELRATKISLPDMPGPLVLSHLVDVTERESAQSRRARQEALTQRLADVTTELLAGAAPEQTYLALAAAAAEVAESDSATVVLPHGPDGRPQRVAVTGRIATRLQADGVPFNPAMVEAVTSSGHAHAWAALPAGADPRLVARVGALAGAPMFLEEGLTGVLAVARGPGDPPFSELDVLLLTRLATQAGLAIQLARARARSERVAVLEDRQRIARDLHDTVIQDLIAVGMQLGFQQRSDADDAATRRQQDLIDQIDGAIRRLRAAVFALQDRTSGSSLSGIAEAIVTEVGRALGYRPTLTVIGPVDEVSREITEQVTAVLREALSNVVRHANASSAEVSLSSDDDRLCLIVDDDGLGIPDRVCGGNGIRNLEHRAQALHGSSTVERRPGGGTRVRWTCPLH
jgi:PAS domain S-box-containing protein